MENFDKCVYYNKKALELQPGNCYHNHSDIGLSYFRLAIKEGDIKYFDKAFKHCREALEMNSGYANALVNMGLIYKHQNQLEDALKQFTAAEKCDPKNIAAIVNIGVIHYEHKQDYDTAAIRFLDALEIKPDDEEALCNLALALKKTQNYVEYAQIAFEEAVNVSPGNTYILRNYMMFLLEQKNFAQFEKVMSNHAKIVMETKDLEMIAKLHEEFKEAIEGTEGHE